MDASPEASLVVRNTFLEFVRAPHRDERVRRHSDSAIVISPLGLATAGCVGNFVEKDRSRLCSTSTAASTGSESPAHSSPSVRDQEMCDRQMQAMDAVLEASSETAAAPWWTRGGQPWVDNAVVREFSSSTPAARPQRHKPPLDEGIWAAARTTVMLRNLPNGYTRAMLLDLLDLEGFADKYDFVYLPIDFARGLCLGYGFINLVSASTADHFVEHFTGFSHWMLSSNKVCCVSWSSPHQGLAQHVERYRNSPVMHSTIPDAWKPLLFAFPSGTATRIAFPPPTKQIRPPNIRRRPEA